MQAKEMVPLTDPGAGRTDMHATGWRLNEPTEAPATQHSQETGNRPPPTSVNKTNFILGRIRYKEMLYASKYHYFGGDNISLYFNLPRIKFYWRMLVECD